MANVLLRRERTGDSGRVVLEVDGKIAGECTFVQARPGEIVADHTYVEPALRGRGLARRLVDELVAWAREDGLKIRATCWYVRDVLDAEPALADVRAA